jgi:RNA polymerase sigma-70 factor (ECF subfamily)
MDSSDCQLLRRAAAGDRDAFAAFYDRHAPAVFGLLLRLLRDRCEAEDVLQEAFLQAWREAGRYDAGRASPAGWLVMLARSRALDRLRRRPPAAAGPAAEPAAPGDAGLAAQQTETQALVGAALARLPAEQRDALCLAFYGGLTHTQVARRQGVPLGTAKTRIRLAMIRLRELLQTPGEAAAP